MISYDHIRIVQIREQLEANKIHVYPQVDNSDVEDEDCARDYLVSELVMAAPCLAQGWMASWRSCSS